MIRGGYGWLGVISGDYGVLIGWIWGAYGVVLLEKVLKYEWRKGGENKGGSAEIMGGSAEIIMRESAERMGLEC